MNEKHAMSGFLTLRVSDREGRLLYERPCKNHIVTSGRGPVGNAAVAGDPHGGRRGRNRPG
jgi:hypothetical protein